MMSVHVEKVVGVESFVIASLVVGRDADSCVSTSCFVNRVDSFKLLCAAISSWSRLWSVSTPCERN